MPQVHYPFIDVAVHPAIRARFAAGDAVVLFSRDLADVLWANGEGARLFGHGAIYDMIEAGPERGGVAFRQLGAAAAQLGTVGDKRGFVMRVTSGFRSAAVPAEVNLIVIGRDEAVMFSAPASGKRDLSALLGGFDDPDTHMALLAADGEAIASSPGYMHVGVSADTARALIAAASRSADGLVKRPIPSGSGYLPAAIGRLADDLYLLFCVETSIGRMDAPEADMLPPQASAEDRGLEEVVDDAAEMLDTDTSVTVSESNDSVAVAGEQLVPVASFGGFAMTEAQADRSDNLGPEADQPAAETFVPDIEEGETEADIGDLAALDGASPSDVDAASADIEVEATETAQFALSGDQQSHVAEDEGTVVLSEPSEPDANLDQAAAEADDVAEESEPGVESAEHPVNETATFESPVSTETNPADMPEAEFAPAAELGAEMSESPVDHDGPTELDADKAEASIEEVGAAVPPVESGELAADLIETAQAAQETPEDYRETHSEVGSPMPAVEAGAEEQAEVESEAWHVEHAVDTGDRVAPTELDADIAEASDDVVIAAAPPVESGELIADMIETADDALEAPADYRENHSEFEASQVALDSEVEHLAEMELAAGEPEEINSSGDAAADGHEPSLFEDRTAVDVAELDTEALAPVYATDRDDVVVGSGNDTPEPEQGEQADETLADSILAVGEAERARIEVAAAEDALAEFEAPDGNGPEAEASPTAEAGHEQPFEFDRHARPVRFVWKLDANGVFAEVSEEFRSAVGPNAGDIVGHAFRDLAALFGLDPEGQIVALLDRRDTWSGRTVKWPVEGTDLVVPVDLAALPTYSRSREFDGFRGFGIIRVSDAETDPSGHGLTIAASVNQHCPDADHSGDSAGVEPMASVDEFRGEVPALDIVSNPMATFADKVIQLEERRAKATRDGLSPSEQAALKEIARQLEPFGKRPNEDILKTSSGLLQTEDGEVTADAQIASEMGQAGDAEIHAADEDDGEDFTSTAQETPAIDDQRMQNLFEDLGSGPGLTPYAIDQVPMAILIHAGDLLIEMNAEFRRLTGYADIASLDRAGGLDALITRREGPDAGVYLVRADGTQVLVSARLQSVRYEGSSALMLALTPAMGSLAAATTEPQVVGEGEPARKLAALQVEIEELRSVLETATDGVVVLDMEGRIRSVNRSAAALFNFDNNEIVGKPFAMLFAHESQKSVQDYLAGLAGHGVASVLNDGREVIGREASGGFIPLFMTMGRMPGSNSYCAVIRDITQWKRSEEELRAAKRAAETANQHKSDFLARVSHEIRTPLNAIIGVADMIATEHFGPAGHPRYAEYASDIGRSGRHVLDIVNDLLDISKIEAGEMDLDFAAVGLNDCVSEAVSLVQPQANAQRVIIRTALSQAVPDVVADLRSIKQIALNILANAIRYTPSGGQIVVSTAYEPSGSVTLRIRDTGVGMSKAELEQAMKPFGQVAPGTRQRGDGTGLGLPLTKAMTEANRASFGIHSAPNEGTLVEISFPPQRVLAD